MRESYFNSLLANTGNNAGAASVVLLTLGVVLSSVVCSAEVEEGRGGGGDTETKYGVVAVRRRAHTATGMSTTSPGQMS